MLRDGEVAEVGKVQEKILKKLHRVKIPYAYMFIFYYLLNYIGVSMFGDILNIKFKEINSDCFRKLEMTGHYGIKRYLGVEQSY